MRTMTKVRKNDQAKNKAHIAQFDEKGRLTVPKELREALGVTGRETVFMKIVDGDLVIRRAINPFDVLVEEALREYREGKTQDLRSFAKEMGIELDE